MQFKLTVLKECCQDGYSSRKSITDFYAKVFYSKLLGEWIDKHV